MLVSRCVGRRQRGGGRVAPSKRDGAASSRMGVAHYNERSVFRSILGLGRTLLAEQVGPNDHAEPRASPPGALDSRSNPTGWIALLTIEHHPPAYRAPVRRAFVLNRILTQRAP